MWEGKDPPRRKELISKLVGLEVQASLVEAASRSREEV
jgi:hypothetical protein